jgi:hypothetical protein
MPTFLPGRGWHSSGVRFGKGQPVMGRAPSAFKQGDVTKVLRAAKAAGLPVYKFEIDRSGRIVVTTAKADDTATDAPANEAPREDIVL